MLEFSFLRLRWQTLPVLQMLFTAAHCGLGPALDSEESGHLCRCPGLSTLCTKAVQTELLTRVPSEMLLPAGPLLHSSGEDNVVGTPTPRYSAPG